MFREAASGSECTSLAVRLASLGPGWPERLCPPWLASLGSDPDVETANTRVGLHWSVAERGGNNFTKF